MKPSCMKVSGQHVKEYITGPTGEGKFPWHDELVIDILNYPDIIERLEPYVSPLSIYSVGRRDGFTYMGYGKEGEMTDYIPLELRFGQVIGDIVLMREPWNYGQGNQVRGIAWSVINRPDLSGINSATLHHINFEIGKSVGNQENQISRRYRQTQNRQPKRVSSPQFPILSFAGY